MNKAQLLKELEEKCRLANLPLKENATNLVFGKGSPSAEIMFIGESPGHNEDIQGLPFVGAAGKNLDKLLSAVGLSLNDVYITNILKYRPPENREPLPEEVKTHTPYLLRQISIIRPKVICSLGNHATKFFFAKCNPDEMDKQVGITKVHGKVKIIEIDGMKIKLIPLFHPAAIIYNQKLKSEWEKDMLIVKHELSQKTLKV
jgi:DNA polymerase